MLLPGPQYPPIVVALIPNDGKESAEDIYKHHITLLRMAAELEIKIITGASDGAAPELSAQNMMDNLPSTKEPILYENLEHGYRIKVAVHETGPYFPNQDPEHGRKTGRNQPQHGTKTASLGEGFIVNRCLVDLCESPDSGMYRADVINVDKQDDGAARRFYHPKGLRACTEIVNGVCCIRDGYLGIFVYLFILGKQTFVNVGADVTS
jgi:hypothetical protein